MKIKDKKKRLYAKHQSSFPQRFFIDAETRAWIDMVPVGKEFGSNDYEKLVSLETEFKNRR